MKRNVKSSAKIVAVAVFAILLVLAIPLSYAAYSVGVKTGDWIKYGEITASWTGTGTEPSYITNMKETEWMKGTVQDVSGTTVTLQVLAHYDNGTESTEIMSGDIATASGNISSLISPSGLKKGDSLPITVMGTVDAVINDTITQTFAGASRSVNVVNITATVGGYDFAVLLCWDQATGILLEYSIQQSMIGQTVQESFKATETNMWSQDVLGTFFSNPYYIAGIVVVIVVVIVAVAYLFMRKKSPQPPKSPEASESASTEEEQE